MRPGEVCHLLVEDADLASATLRVRNHPEIGWKTKTRTERRVALVPEVLAAVREAVGGMTCGPVFLAPRYASGGGRPPLAGLTTAALSAELAGRVAAALAARESASPRLVEERIAIRLWKDAGAITPKQLRLAFIAGAKRIGRPDLTCPKTFRHGMATAMQEAGVDPFVRCQVIGHASLETTGIYTHTSDRTIGREMAKVALLHGRALEVARERAGTTA